MPSLRPVLTNPKAFDLDHALFADRGTLSLDANCLVLDTSGVDVSDVPAEARAASYDDALTMDDVDPVVDNLSDQVSDPATDLRFMALRFYLDWDAFIAL